MPEEEFFDVADRFIELANELVREWGTPRVSAALLFAATRFNAHNFFSTDGEERNRKRAVKYYCAQYRKMLLENMDTLAGNQDSRLEERKGST